MKIGDEFVILKSAKSAGFLRGKTIKIVENRPNPTERDIPSFEHGFVHYEMNGHYVGFSGVDWLAKNSKKICI